MHTIKNCELYIIMIYITHINKSFFNPNRENTIDRENNFKENNANST
jgi:hypothetical protein